MSIRSRHFFVLAALICAVFFMWGSHVAHAAVTLVQATSTFSYANPQSQAFGSSLTAGDTIVVVVEDYTGTSITSGVTSVTDTRGNHFTVVTSTQEAVVAPDYGLDMWTAIAYATGTAAGADTITANLSDPSHGGTMAIYEITSSTLDLVSVATGTSAHPSAGTVNTANNGEFAVVGFNQDDSIGEQSAPGNQVLFPGLGWTIYGLFGGGSGDQGGEYEAQSVAGSLTGIATSSWAGSFVTSTWTASMATFAPPGSGAPSPCASDTILFDGCSTDYFVRGQYGSIYGNANSTDFTLHDSGQVLALPLMTSADFEIQSGVLAPVFKAVKPAYTQVHYQWRNDNGSESGATSATGGVEDTLLSGLTQNTSVRVRLEITNAGGTIFSYSPQSFQLQYGLLSTTCSAISSWTVVGAAGSVWSMYNSSNIHDGSSTTNIATSTGGLADANHTFITSNAGVKTTTSTVAAISVPSDSFMEAEFDVEALSSSTPNDTYCFRLTNVGAPTNFVYSQYPEATVAASQSITLTLNTSTVKLPNLGPGIAVSATTTATVNVTGATSGYTVSIQRNSATSTLASSTITFPDYTSWAPSGSSCASGQGNGTTTPGSTFSFRVASSGTTANYCSFWWGASDAGGTALYAGVPTTTQIIVNSTSSASQNGTTTVTILYTANAPVSQKATSYTGGVTITAIANP